MFKQKDRIRFIGEGQMHFASGTILKDQLENEPEVFVQFDYWYGINRVNPTLLELIPEGEDRTVHP
jgi:hypothetical protein